MLTEQDIQTFEKQVGRKIPSEYREFLLSYNGGSPDPFSFSAFSNKKSQTKLGDVDEFLSINGTKKTLTLSYILKTFGDRIPSDFFPIARDAGGNLIGIIVQGDDLGQIYFWDHEYESEDGAVPTKENLFFIANHFAEFLASLHD